MLRLVLGGGVMLLAVALLAGWPLSLAREASVAAVVRGTVSHDVFVGLRFTRGRVVFKSYWGAVDPHGTSWPRSYAQNYFAVPPGGWLGYEWGASVAATLWNQQPWYLPYVEAHLQRPVVQTRQRIGELVVSVHAGVLAGVLLLVAAAVGFGPARRVLQRRYRIQSNLCLHCGYKLKGVEGDYCPECGAKRPVFTFARRAV